MIEWTANECIWKRRCFSLCISLLQRIEYQRDAAWYGLALFHLHPNWLDKSDDAVILKKLLGLTLDVHHTQSSWLPGVLVTKEAKDVVSLEWL